MLIEKNLKDKRKSWYICDMCGNKLTATKRYIISINYKKEWDLCKRCIKELKKFCEKEV